MAALMHTSYANKPENTDHRFHALIHECIFCLNPTKIFNLLVMIWDFISNQKSKQAKKT